MIRLKDFSRYRKVVVAGIDEDGGSKTVSMIGKDGGESEEVAELVLWLSSSKSSFVTGAYYPIDGGYLAQ